MTTHRTDGARERKLREADERNLSLLSKAAAAFASQEAGDSIELRATYLGVYVWKPMLKHWTADEWADYFKAGGEYRVAP